MPKFSRREELLIDLIIEVLDYFRDDLNNERVIEKAEHELMDILENAIGNEEEYK